MSRLMDYGPDWPPMPSETAVPRMASDEIRAEMRQIVAARPFWRLVTETLTLRRLLSEVVAPVLVVVVAAAIGLYIYGRQPVHYSFPIDHGTTISHTPGGQR